MPIVGMTKTVDGENIAGLTRIGKLHKGAPKEKRVNKAGKEYEVVGRDLPYFRMVFEPQFEDLMPIWERIYGEEPTEFNNVRLAGRTVDEAFDNWREHWTASTMLHRCDGVRQVCFYNTDTHKYINDNILCVSPIDPATGQRPKNCECKPVGRLKLLFPEFIGESGVLGYIEVGTTSSNDIIQVGEYLAGIQLMYGNLSTLPFVFGREAREISTPVQEKQGNAYVTTGRARRDMSLFYILLRPDFVQQAVLPAFAETPRLPAPQPLMTVQEAKGKLGSGNPDERRIGSERTTQPEPVVPPPHWMSDPEQFAKFLDWAKEQFDYDEDDIVFAFDNAVDYRIDKSIDWREGTITTRAAVIAASCEYDVKRIEKVTSSGYAVEIYDRAVEIAQKVMAEAEEPETEVEQ